MVKLKTKYLYKLLPIIVLFSLLLIWEVYINLSATPSYILPKPSYIFITLYQDWEILYPSMMNTLEISIFGFLLAGFGGVIIAIFLSYSKIIQDSLLPLAIILQVTPLIAISPLIIIYIESTYAALLICVWLVAFFPVLSNTIFGLNNIDNDLSDLFKLYNASRSKTLLYLRIPHSVPSILSGLKIAAGLSLIGAIVAEFVAGAGGTSSGLAFRIIESGYRINIPRMFACIILLAAMGISLHKLLEFISYLLLRKWHDNYN
tara:strand:- start:39097 stop:39879 length:783 start_codon:yes stop_codon:yes gene_type:complete